MNRSRLSGPVTFCVTAVILLPAVCASADTLHVGPGQTYATIQSAIDASFFGDEILVHDGLYQENVVVDKAVAVRARSWVISSDNTGAVLDAGEFGDLNGFTVTAAGASVEGFSVCNALGYTPLWKYRSGIAVEGVGGVLIVHNRCGWDEESRNSINISISEASGCTVLENSTAEGSQGIVLEDASGNLIQGNICRDHSLDSSSAGVYMMGSVDSYTGIWNTRDNLIVENDFGHCTFGVHFDSSCKGNTVQRNRINLNYIGVGSQGGSNGNVIVNNEICENSNRGIWLNMSYSNLIAGNTLDDNNNGIWLGFMSPSDYGCDNTMITANIITNNSYAGIRISAKSDDNRMAMNHFAGNLNHVISEGTDWSTPTAVSYFHGSSFSGRLGNYYDSYTGADLDGDGIGDEDLPFIDGDPDYGPVEYHPLVDSPAAYEIQAWYLANDAGRTMSRRDWGGMPGEVELENEESIIWISEHPAVGEVTFAAGVWTGMLSFVDWLPADSFAVEIGYSTDGTDFTPSGAEAAIGGDWDAAFATVAAAVTVPDRGYLALRVTNSAGWTIPLRTGGMTSYVSSPGVGDPDWPHGVGTAVPASPVPTFLLHQNAPNPFNPRTVIAFDLTEASVVRLRVHDLAGRLLRTLVGTSLMSGGPHRVTWDGIDAAGRSVGAGAYIYRLEVDGVAASRRMLLVR